MSDSVQPHRRQSTRLPHPWNSPGKNIGVGCHFLLQCMKVKSESEVAQLCLTLSDPMDCSPPGSSGFSRQEYRSGVPLPSPPTFPNSIQLAKILPSISKEIAFSSPYVSLSWDLFQSTTPALVPSLPLFLPVRGRENYLIGEFKHWV